MTCKEPKRIMRKASRGGCKPGAQAIRQPCNEFPARSRAFDLRYGLQEGALARSGTANQRLFVPGRQAFSFTQKTGIT